MIARRFGGRIAKDVAPLDLNERLERARALAIAGKLDGAAALLDTVLDEGERAPERVADPSAFIAGQVRRVSIAIARREVARARSLLSRLLRYDPTFIPTSDEDSPQLSHLLAEVRRPLSAAPVLDAADLGDACHLVDVLIVARIPNELSRFDNCRLVAQASTGSDEEVVETLSRVVPPSVFAERRSRGKVIAGAVVAAAGVVLAATGIYFAATAASRANHIADNCSSAAPCPLGELSRRGDAYDSAKISAAVILPIGAAALATGAALYLVGRKQARHHFALGTGSATWGFEF
jgi:hypothetical protein